MQNAWRQGDIGILAVSAVPESAKEIQHDGVLAYGETTGHKHQLVGGKVRYFRDNHENLFFEVTSRFVMLCHGSVPTAREQGDGHFAHRLPAGVYKINRQREFDWQNELLRNVED